MNKWFTGLTQREQLSVLILAIAVGLYLLFVLIWSPLSDRRDAMALRKLSTSESLQRVDAMVSELTQLRATGGSRSSRTNLTSLINQSTSDRKLQVSRLQPNSRGELQVRLENASFDDTLAWLYDMEFVHGLLVREVSVTRSGAPGRVNASVRLAQGK